MKFYMVKERIDNRVKVAYVQEISIKCDGDIYIQLMAMLVQCDIVCKTSYEAVQIAEKMNAGKCDLQGEPVKTIIVWENIPDKNKNFQENLTAAEKAA